MDIDRERHRMDAAEQVERSRTDQERDAERNVQDQKRRTGHGHQQSRENVRREREGEDARLEAERVRAGDSRRAERGLVDKIIEHESDARGGRAVHRADEAKELLGLVRQQLQVVAENLTVVMKNVPRGEFEGRLSENVGAIRAAIARVDVLVASAPSDPDNRGGSG